MSGNGILLDLFDSLYFSSKICGSDQKKVYSWGCSQYKINLVHTHEHFLVCQNLRITSTVGYTIIYLIVTIEKELKVFFVYFVCCYFHANDLMSWTGFS